MRTTFHKLLYLTFLSAFMFNVQAVEVNALFSDHMVLQRDTPTKIWGQGAAGEKVSVTLGSQSKETITDENGQWALKLDPTEAGGPHRLIIKGNNTITINDVLFGEVWVCSGQSNMQWPLTRNRDVDLQALKKHPSTIRIITVPQKGTHVPQSDFNGSWSLASNWETLQHFSAVGYHFGKNLHDVLDIPIGLISCNWGGSAAEAWVSRDLLTPHERYADYIASWKEKEDAGYDAKAAAKANKENTEAWKEAVKEAKAKGEKPPKKPRNDNRHIEGQHRPANLYNGMLKAIMGYGMRGVIWYQGESNTGRAKDYKHLISTLISSWRAEWGIGDFPFYWVNLANFQARTAIPQESSWAELREAQSQTLGLPHTGEALAIDIGEASDIHPGDKQTVGNRLARIALARDYGKSIAWQNPQFDRMEINGARVTLHFKYVGQGLRSVDQREIKGFAIAGSDGHWVWAQAKLEGKDQIIVWNDQVSNPTEVRYNWANNPDGNIYSQERLPLTPFRTTGP